MKAMQLEKVSRVAENPRPLREVERPEPRPGPGEILVRVSACAVCHTELDEIEGRTPPPAFPVIPGHQVVGRVEALGPGASRFAPGARVGVGWIARACGRCVYCATGRENLCDGFMATGRDVDGGYAEYMTVAEAFAFPVPGVFSDETAAPLFCAGAIGWRSLRLSGAGEGMSLGLTGFGASAHLVLKLARYRFPSITVFVFARSEAERDFARSLGAAWAGDTKDAPPGLLDAIIDTTPAWTPVVAAMRNLKKGGRLVINAIRKESFDKAALMELDYPQDLWLEKEIKSVANVTRADIAEFLDLAAKVPIVPEVERFPLADANAALSELASGRVRGAKVLVTG